MLQSMTGYGQASEMSEDWKANIEIKTVNNRFLDIQIRSPKNLLYLENKFKQILGQFINRGSVQVQIQYEEKGHQGHTLTLQDSIFQQYIQVWKHACHLSQTAGDLNSSQLLEILKFPDVIQIQNQSDPAAEWEARLLPLFTKACQTLQQSRFEEGNVLQKDLLQRVQGLSEALHLIREKIPQRQKEWIEKFRQKIKDLIQGSISPHEDRLLTEIGIQAERLDITEECVRFEAHCQLFMQTLEQKAPGKKLGFILQELLREINTLGNKSQYTDISHLCVQVKEELEIIREQLQNIE